MEVVPFNVSILFLLVVHEISLLLPKHVGVESDEIQVAAWCGVVMASHLIVIPHRFLCDIIVDTDTDLRYVLPQGLTKRMGMKISWCKQIYLLYQNHLQTKIFLCIKEDFFPHWALPTHINFLFVFMRPYLFSHIFYLVHTHWLHYRKRFTKSFQSNYTAKYRQVIP